MSDKVISPLATLEAILFAAGDPVETGQLETILGLDTAAVEKLAQKLMQTYDERESALTLRQVAGGYQLVTRPEYFFAVEQLNRVKERKLSAPMLETLAIIAFRQPITKQEIEKIRNVQTADHVLSRLTEMELIVEVGRKKAVGHPILYGTTEVFLQSFGLNSLKDLPTLPSLAEAALGLPPEQLSLLENEMPEEDGGNELQ